MASLPRPIATLLAAANGHDTNAFVACFTEDGVVDDWGRLFRGRDAIRVWSDAEFVGVDVHLGVVEVSAGDRFVTVRAMVGGNGFNGPSHFTFTHDGDRVARMEIRA
jgi:hypothetical protein